MQILMHIEIGHDPTAERIVFQIVDHPIGLIHHPLLILMFYAHLIAVGLSDGSVLVRPGIPDMTVKVMNIVGFFLPDPKHFIRRTLKRRPPKRQDRKLLRQIIPVHHAKLFDRISRCAILPVRSDPLPLGAGPILQYILTHANKYLIR